MNNLIFPKKIIIKKKMEALMSPKKLIIKKKINDLFERTMNENRKKHSGDSRRDINIRKNFECYI